MFFWRVLSGITIDQPENQKTIFPLRIPAIANLLMAI